MLLEKEGAWKATREVAGEGINEEPHLATARTAGWEGHWQALVHWGRVQWTHAAKNGLPAGWQSIWRGRFCGSEQGRRPHRQREGMKVDRSKSQASSDG